MQKNLMPSFRAIGSYAWTFATKEKCKQVEERCLQGEVAKIRSKVMQHGDDANDSTLER